MAKKKALITGITGQDGSYLAELLLEKDYEVWGLFRRSSTDPLERIGHIRNKLKLKYGNLYDSHSIESVLKESKPDEIYNLAAQSDVWISFKVPEETKEVNYQGLKKLVNIVRNLKLDSKIYQASTSEMFGNITEGMITEETGFDPQSPYAKSKVDAHEEVVKHRREGMFICSGFLFNHESPRRGKHFVTRKIISSFARIKLGVDYPFSLGNLNAKRDWGYAKDYVKAMWMMLQQDKPKDYVIATGKSYTIKDFVNKTAKAFEMPIGWEGEGANEKAYFDGKEIINIDPEFYRPKEVDKLCGDFSKARKELGWKPEVGIDELVRIMAESDLKEWKKELA